MRNSSLPDQPIIEPRPDPTILRKSPHRLETLWRSQPYQRCDSADAFQRGPGLSGGELEGACGPVRVSVT